MIEDLSAWFSETNKALLIGGGAAASLLFVFMWIARFLYLCRPSEILIFSGRKHRLPDGTIIGSRVVFGGRAWRIPIIETVQRRAPTRRWGFRSRSGRSRSSSCRPTRRW